MSDLVKWLRNSAKVGSSNSTHLMEEAADRIEALEAALNYVAEISECQLGRLVQIARAALAPEQDK